MRSPDPRLPEVFTRAEALAAGLSESQVKTRVRNGTWRLLRRGVCCQSAVWEARHRRGRHLLTAQAVLRRVGDDVWLSHASASVAHDLPIPRADGPVWLTRLPPRGTCYRPGITIEAATLPLADQWTVGGLPVTSRRRTVADCLRHCQPPDGLAIADAAFRREPHLMAEVELILGQCAEWPYVARGARVLAVADGRRESPLESWSYWYMHQYSVPMPEPQVDIYDQFGRWLGRVDAWWHEFGVIGEADGRAKYEVPPDGDVRAVERALYDEKMREDLLRATGAGFVRWGNRDLADPRRWTSDLMRRLLANEVSRFRGRAIPVSRSA